MTDISTHATTATAAAATANAVAIKATYIRTADGLFKCPFCTVTKERQNTMFYHMKKHTGDMKYICSVPGCDRRFIQKSGLDQHTAQAHPVGDHEMWGCPCCDHSCRMKANMQIHIARMHLPQSADNGSCAKCDKSFCSATAYFYHAYSCSGTALEPELVASKQTQS